MQIEEYFRAKVCVVTGAASGIGFACAARLLQADAIVMMADRDTKTLDAAVKQLGAPAGRVHSLSVDVTQQEQVQQLIQDAALRHGRVDVLFNNAGIGCTMPIGQITLAHWRRLMDVNLWGVIYGIDAVLPIMRRQGGGHIVNTASVAGLVPFPYQAVYAASKYAVVGLSECLRFELADEGIQVSVACPGDVATRIFGTPIFGERLEVKPPPGAISAEEAAQTILAGVANQEGIIVLPETVRQLWLKYCRSPEAVHGFLRDLARQRRQSYETHGHYYPTEK